MSVMGGFLKLNSRMNGCIRMMSHGDVGVKIALYGKKYFFVSLVWLFASFNKSLVKQLLYIYPTLSRRFNCVVHIGAYGPLTSTIKY